MNSRERVLAAIKHEEPDKVPIDIGSHPSSSISAIAYSRLKNYLEIEEGNIRIYDLSQQLAQVEDEIIERFQIDAIDVGKAYNTDDDDWYDVHINGIDAQFPAWFQPIFNDDGSLEVTNTEGTVLARMSKDALVIDQTHYPYEESYPKTMNDFLKALPNMPGFEMVNPPFDHLNIRGFWRDLRRRIKDLRENTDKALVLSAGISFFQFGTSMKPMDKFLMDFLKRPTEVEKFLDLVLEFQMVQVSMICKYVGDLVDIICIADDYGENSGPFMNPKIFRRMIKPKLRAVCEYIRKNSSMHILLHCCGSIIPLIPDFIDVGIEILNPVQINAKGMEPEFLKENFGDEIAFWGGGADTRNVLNRKSPEQVKAHVSQLLETFSEGGGYIWNTVHNILPDVPPENIVAMIEAVHKFNAKWY
jgi:uroporphyrinogen decarboxylase